MIRVLVTALTLAIVFVGASSRTMAQTAGCASARPECALAVPAAAATLSRDIVSAATNSDALIDVQTAGRFMLRVESKTGVAIQLIDMMIGPGERAGEVGIRDGRLDVLLDKGVYKLRIFGAKGAAGDARLSIAPFQEAEAIAPALAPKALLASSLSDLKQRSYWISVGKPGRISIEAAGRALQDLRLWHNGRDLAEQMPAAATIEPKPGHTLTRLRLEGALEPGIYRVTAYGGEPLPWADGDKAEPFHLRVGEPDKLVGGLIDGAIGPLGSMRFEAPADATAFRLELPEPTAARLVASRGGSLQTGVIAKNSREPVVTVNLAASGSNAAFLDVTGFEGQRFRLRALRPATSLRIDQSGLYQVSVDVAGEGGDELPATVLLARYESGKPTTVLASSGPRLAPGQAWRSKFNLRGPSSLIFEVTAPGPVALTSEGPGLTASMQPLTGVSAPRADGSNPRLWNLESGWYLLRINPIDGAAGIVDMTIGQPGLKPAFATATPPRSTIPLGLYQLGRAAYYQIFAGNSPGLLIGPKARALPADLATAPLTVVQTPDQPVLPAPVARPVPVQRATVNPPKPLPANAPPTKIVPAKAAPEAPVVPKTIPAGPLDLPIRAPADGTIVATEADGTAVAITWLNSIVTKGQREATARIAPSAKPRTITLSWSAPAPTPSPIVPEPESAMTALGQDKAQFFDLKAGERRSFRLNLEAGGLYKIETTGRLNTSATIGSAFIPKIDDASDNGAGHNALLQVYLRAGSYRLGVSASESSGHLGLVGKPAALLDANPIVAGEASRASLSGGRGAVFPISVTEAGQYRLDLFGLDRTFTARIEDAEGWPITTPGELSRLDHDFEPGRYRLVVLPEEVDARAVARLQRITEPKPMEGHGPHLLPFDSVQHYQWREPTEKTGARDADRWEFALQGPAHIALDIGDGMIGDLFSSADAKTPLARIIDKRGFSGLLPAGNYVVEARSLGRNDRLDYDLTLRADEIQPGIARKVDLPATIPFAIARDRVVNLTTFGRTDLRAVLKDSDDHVIERLSGRLDDWNIGLSRALPAGAYKLELAAAGAGQSAEADNSSSEDGNTTETDEDKVEIHLALPETIEFPAPALTGTQTLTGPSVHQVALPTLESGQLLLVGLQSSSETVLFLERQGSDGKWRMAGSARGVAPLLAVPADDAGRPWRLSTWTVDGSASTTGKLAIRAVRAQAQMLGTVKLDAVPFDGIGSPRVASIEAPSASLLSLEGAAGMVSQGSSPGRVLSAAEDGVLALQSTRLWLLSQNPDVQEVTVKAAPAISGEIALGLAAGDRANLPSDLPAEGHLRLWRAESTQAQPGLEAGRGMGVAPGSTVAFSGDTPISVWNAGSDEALRLRLAALDVTVTSGAISDGRFTGVLLPMSGQRIALPSGENQIALDLSGGVAALLTGDANVTVWTGLSPVSRRLDGRWSEVLLVNISSKPVPASVTITPTDHTGTLAAGSAIKRFLGAAGSFNLPVDAGAGDTLTVVGGKAVFTATSGQVGRGDRLSLSGPGRVTIEHGPGLVAVWIEGPGKSPWPSAEAVTTALPGDVKLEGQAMRFALHQDQPVLLHARSNAPVILMLRQDNRQETPVLFPSGAEFHRYLAAGNAELRAFSAHDGPLAGSLQLTATPVRRIGEGLGEPLALAPGQTALFAFDVTRAAETGIGVRADPDRAVVRLLDEYGQALGDGVTQIRRLQPGRYLIEARIPADGATTIIRPAVIGISPPPAGPPPEITQQYLELVGLGPARPQ